MLLHLLLELQEKVFNYCSTKDLKNISCTCSAFNRMLKPRFFRHARVHALHLSSKGFFEKRQCAKQILKVLKDTESLHITSIPIVKCFCRIPGSAYKAVSKLRWLKELYIDGEYLYIEHTSFSRLFDGLRLLRKLALNQTWGVTDISIAGIGKLTNLEELSLNGSQITSVGLSYVSALDSLTKLDLSDTAIHNYGISLLMKLSRLKRLILADCWNLSNVCTFHINTFPYLEELVLAGCSITDKGIYHLTSLSMLTKLNCSGVCITDDTLMHIFTHLNTITQLIISGAITGDISDESKVYLTKLCPGYSSCEG